MGDYISRQAATKFINDCLVREDELQSVEKATLLSVKDRIEAIPPADVVPVVRCRDCKHYEYMDNRIPSEKDWICCLSDFVVKQDDFCSFGVRREEDGE